MFRGIIDKREQVRIYTWEVPGVVSYRRGGYLSYYTRVAHLVKCEDFEKVALNMQILSPLKIHYERSSNND